MNDDFDQQFDDDFDDDFEEETPEDDFDDQFEEAEEEPEDNFDDQGFEDDGFEEQEEQEDEGDTNDYDKPVAEGDTVEVEIEDLGSKGDGIARVEGFVIFVPGGEVGESYDVEVTSVGRKFAFAEIVE